MRDAGCRKGLIVLSQNDHLQRACVTHAQTAVKQMIVIPPHKKCMDLAPSACPTLRLSPRYPKCAPSGILRGGGGGGPCDLCDEFLLVEEDKDLADVLCFFCLRAGMLANIMTAVRRRAVAIIPAAMMPAWIIAGLCERGCYLCYLCLFEWVEWWSSGRLVVGRVVCLCEHGWEMERSGDSGSEWYDIGPIGRKVMWQRGLDGRTRERHLAGSINFGFCY